ncbi:MAG TPA: hypothetical protein VJM47_09500 [Nitrosospira sp.]|nr:hypothetical protein [Nitrosospira sp.]
MTNSNGTTQDEYDEILRKLEILLSRHQRMSSTRLADDDGRTTGDSSRFSRNAAKQAQPDVDIPTLTEVAAKQSTSHGNIPTLTEVVHSAPSTLSPADITMLLEKILNSALNETGVGLNPKARKTLIQALKSRLFGL